MGRAIVPHLYFFRTDKTCAWLNKEIGKTVPRYLRGPVAYEDLEPRYQRRIPPYQGKKRFFVVLDWTSRSVDSDSTTLLRGASPEWMQESGLAVVRSRSCPP